VSTEMPGIIRYGRDRHTKLTRCPVDDCDTVFKKEDADQPTTSPTHHFLTEHEPEDFGLTERGDRR